MDLSIIGYGRELQELLLHSSEYAICPSRIYNVAIMTICVWLVIDYNSTISNYAGRP